MRKIGVVTLVVVCLAIVCVVAVSLGVWCASEAVITGNEVATASVTVVVVFVTDTASAILVETTGVPVIDVVVPSE